MGVGQFQAHSKDGVFAGGGGEAPFDRVGWEHVVQEKWIGCSRFGQVLVGLEVPLGAGRWGM